MTSVWNLSHYKDGTEAPPTVSLDTGGAVPSGLPGVLHRLTRCGLGNGHVLLALLASHTIDPWRVWEVLWKDSAEFPELWSRDSKPSFLFVQNFGFFPFGERLAIEAAPKSSAEGLLVVDLQTSAYCFLRQTQTMGITNPASADLPEAIQVLLATARSYYGGDYCPVWVMQPEDLERQIGSLPENDPTRNLFIRDLFIQEQIRGGIRLAKEQWALERARLQIDETTIPGPGALADAQDVLTDAQKQPPTLHIPPGVRIESPAEDET